MVRGLEIPEDYLDVLRSAKVSMSALHGLFGSTTYPITRRELVSCIEEHNTVLEIGPFTNPLVRGKNVRYFDVLNKEELIIRARKFWQLSSPPSRIPLFWVLVLALQR